MSAALRRKALTIGIGIAVLGIFFDLVTKALVFDRLLPEGGGVEIFPFFNIVHAWNTGVSFSLFADGPEVTRWVLVAVAVIIAVALFFWLRSVERRFLAAAIGFIIGGAIGNVYDRIVYGAVRDFLDVHAAGYHWPAFNVADSCITVGVVMVLIDSFLGSGRKSADEASGAGPAA